MVVAGQGLQFGGTLGCPPELIPESSPKRKLRVRGRGVGRVERVDELVGKEADKAD